MDIVVRVYGVLKDSFAPEQTIECSEGLSLGELRERLIQKNKSAAGVLFQSRAAAQGNFVDWSYCPVQGEIVDLMPPSSGG